MAETQLEKMIMSKIGDTNSNVHVRSSKLLIVRVDEPSNNWIAFDQFSFFNLFDERNF